MTLIKTSLSYVVKSLQPAQYTFVELSGTLSPFKETMLPSNQIRLLVLGLIRSGDRILLAQGYDPVKQETFYRALGGGVDFGESSYDALKREFQEEIKTELTNIKYLGCIENIF